MHSIVETNSYVTSPTRSTVTSGFALGRMALSGIVLTTLLALTPSQAFASSNQFSRACESADSVTIAAVGDILPHAPLQMQSVVSNSFLGLWAPVIPWLKEADVAYGNLEGPTAQGVATGGRVVKDPGFVYDGSVYSGSKMVFNFHPRILVDLKNSGFDIISTANNHALDRAGVGVDRTIDAFRSTGLTFVGTRKSNEPPQSWARLVQKQGWTIAFISCTEGTNGWPDKANQVLKCGANRETIVREIQALRRNADVDAIIVTPHWGAEYEYQPNSSQTSLAKTFTEAGADAIIGAHPHVPQPVKRYVTKDGRETLIAYSLGNFVSNQSKRVGQRLTAVLYVGLSKRRNGRAWVNGYSYLPLWMDRSPFQVNLLSQSRQAPHKEASALIQKLFDGSRELSGRDRVRTNLECYR